MNHSSAGTAIPYGAFSRIHFSFSLIIESGMLRQEAGIS